LCLHVLIVLDVEPLRQEIPKLTMILDAQGILQYSVFFDKEEGEIIHCLSKEQIADMFRLNPDDVVVDEAIPASDIPSPESMDEFDEVEVEDVTDQHYPTYQTSDDVNLPDLSDLFSQRSDEVLKRKIEEKEKESDKGPAKIGEADLIQRKKEWLAYMAKEKEHVFLHFLPNLLKFIDYEAAKLKVVF
jgi:hypothetical protein